MNLLTLKEAKHHLNVKEINSEELKDPYFLPLGISPEMR